MSIVGITIDYGPFGFLDYYDPNYMSQASDARRRNSFKNQPELCKWNLLTLAEAIQDVLPLHKSRTLLEDLFDSEFQRCYMAKMKLKLGLLKKELPTDEKLITALFDTMEKTGADFTNTFRCLSDLTPKGCPSSKSDEDIIEYLVSQCVPLQGLIKAYSTVLEWSQMIAMCREVWKSSPNVISHIEKEADKHLLEDKRRRDKIEQLKESTQKGKEDNDRVLWTQWIRAYKARLDLECDQLDAEEVNKERVKVMKANNPRFILRNYIAQRAIEAAENGDFSLVQTILKRLKTPYGDDVEFDQTTLYEAASTYSSSSCNNEKTGLFNSPDTRKTNLDKLPDDAFNMRLS